MVATVSLRALARWFSSFPSSRPGIQFLQKYDCRAAMFVGFANHCAFGHRLPDAAREAEIERVFDAAVTLFPSDGALFQADVPVLAAT